MNRRQELAVRVIAVTLAAISFLHGAEEESIAWMLVVPIVLLGGIVVYGLRRSLPQPPSPDQDAGRATRATSPGTTDEMLISNLERLARLRHEGFLTEEEYQAEKGRLLAK